MENKGKTKEKRRNTEKRKERSRFAARCRRSKESEIFSNLAQVIPIQESNVSSLDKATIMRLVIAQLRIRNLFAKIPISDLEPHENDSHFLKAISGIVLVLSVDGDVVYVSANVTNFLGLSEVDIIGQSIFDICHPCDHKEVKDILAGKSEDNEGKISFFLRMKCTLTQNGRTLHLKSASYKVLHIFGSMLKLEGNDDMPRHFAAIASPIPHPESIEIPLGSYTFLSKHSLDMKYIYADDKMKTFLGYAPGSLIGKSLYEFHHVQDYKIVQKAFKSLFAKGQSETSHYRFLTKGGGYVWVYTQATIIYCEKGNKPESVVCVNYVVSERQNCSEVFSTSQMLEQKVQVEDCKEEETIKKRTTSTSKIMVKLNSKLLDEKRPQPVTSKVFTPRTADMNKGYLTFDSGCTVLKEDPDDLTHLAPTAGDTCIPLCEPYSLIVDDFSTMSDTVYTSPLLDSQKDASLFIKCDDYSSSSLSPLLSKSPGSCSIPSLCSVDDPAFDDSSINNYLGQDINDNRSSGFNYSSDDSGLPHLLGFDLPWFSPNSAISPCVSPFSQEYVLPDVVMTSQNKVVKDGSTTTKPVTIQPFQDQGGGAKSILLASNSSSSTSGETETRKRTSIRDDSTKLKKIKKILETGVNHSTAANDSLIMGVFPRNLDISSGGYACINTRKKDVSSPQILSKT